MDFTSHEIFRLQLYGHDARQNEDIKPDSSSPSGSGNNSDESNQSSRSCIPTATSIVSGLYMGVLQKVQDVDVSRLKHISKNSTYLGRIIEVAPKNMGSTVTFQVFINYLYKKILEKEKALGPLDDLDKVFLSMSVGYMATLLTNPIECLEQYPNRLSYYNKIYPRLDGLKRFSIAYPKFATRAHKNALMALGFLELPDQILDVYCHDEKSRGDWILLAAAISGVFTALVTQPFNFIIEHHISSEKGRYYFAAARSNDFTQLSRIDVNKLPWNPINWKLIYKGLGKKIFLYPFAINFFQQINREPVQSKISDLCDRLSKMSL